MFYTTVDSNTLNKLYWKRSYLERKFFKIMLPTDPSSFAHERQMP